MRRTEWLFQIIQFLRSTRSPVTGQEIADEIEVSLSTLYRDIAEPYAQRGTITGEAGMAYVLGEGYAMPPVMLAADELDAAALWAAWVASDADRALTRGCHIQRLVVVGWHGERGSTSLSVGAHLGAQLAFLTRRATMG